MRLLVTGASGLLGLNLALRASQDHQVVGVVHSHPLPGAPFPVQAVDLTDPRRLIPFLDEVQPDVVINCAAVAILDTCEAHPDRAWQVNVDLPAWLAQETARRGIRLVHFSTDAVFDGAGGRYTEEDAPRPVSVYSRSKLAGEQAVLEANSEAVVTRVNFFGWSLKGERSLAEWFFYNLAAGRSVKGFTDVYFCPLLVSDLAGIVLKTLDCPVRGLYHLFSPECISKYEFAVRLARQFGFATGLVEPALLVDAGLKAARSPNLCMSSEKFVRETGLSLPAVDESLARFHQQWLDGYPQQIHQFARA